MHLLGQKQVTEVTTLARKQDLSSGDTREQHHSTKTHLRPVLTSLAHFLSQKVRTQREQLLRTYWKPIITGGEVVPGWR